MKKQTEDSTSVAAVPESRRCFLHRLTQCVAMTPLFARNAEGQARPVGLLRLKLADFPELQSASGSIRIDVLNGATDIPPIIITRGTGAVFYAVTSVCTHMGCILNPYDPAQGAIVCPCHDSHFEANGVRFGGPARDSLAPYQIQFDGAETLTVEIPRIGFKLAGALVADAFGGPRLKLQFSAMPWLRYQIVGGAPNQPVLQWNPVKFALTAEGPAEETVFSSPTATLTTVYIPASGEPGFCAVVAS